MDPCGQCLNSSIDGIQCDKCLDWWCLNCINANVEGTITKSLYEALTELEEFQWECETCSPVNLLPLQLKQKKICSVKELAKHKVNAQALKPRTIATSDDPIQSMTKLMQMMTEQMQLQAQQNKEEMSIMMKERREEMDKLIDIIKTSPQAPPNDSTSPTMIHKALPKLELRKFGGDPIKWPDFWDSFKINVHDRRELDNTFKMEYLLQSLVGPPYDKIKAFGIDGSKYQDAIKILERDYGSPIVRQERTLQSLQNLPQVKGNWSNLESYVNELQCLVASLQ